MHAASKDRALRVIYCVIILYVYILVYCISKKKKNMQCHRHPGPATER
jgi:hypothetical protein